jgi:pimeloyl-ACP methyl ester carboxylesterase/catechol 2,3-dioxygenase-like lactoylglutathione lyase family enzyme
LRPSAPSRFSSLKAAGSFCPSRIRGNIAYAGANAQFEDQSTDLTDADMLLLVLLPGLDGTGKLFVKFIEALGDRVDTQVIGYPSQEPLGYEELESLVRAALPEHRPYVILAESFGGPIAMRIAASRPRDLVGLILCATFAKNPYPRLGWASRLTFLVPIKSLPRWVRAPLMWGSASAVRVPPRAERAIATVASAVVRRRLAALLTVDATASLERIDIPAIIIYAKHDRVVRYSSTCWLAAHLPGAEIEPIEGPHLLLQAMPEACAGAVRRFLRKNSQPRSGSRKIPAMRDFPGNAKAMTFIVTRDRARAKAFYGGVLGFEQTSEDDFAAVFDLNGTMLRISTVDDHRPPAHTVLGWSVPDIAATVTALKAKGVAFTVYPGFGQDELGIWTSPAGGARVAWFLDPDGNNLSLTQFDESA